MTSEDRSFEDLLADAHRERGKGRVIGGVTGSEPRFEVYHAGFSICSHKVRATLFEKGLAFVSHEMALPLMGRFIPDCYRPAYVRLRMAGAAGVGLVAGYTGRSAVSSEGFDPCVVPTLVDREKRRVVVDSSVICRYLDDHGPAGNTTLVPQEHSDAIARQEAVIDAAPHPAVLYGPTPGGDRRPPIIARMMPGVSDRKCAVLERLIERVGDDPTLAGAYRAKIAKEMGSKAFTGDQASMRRAVEEMETTVESLAMELAANEGPWACGETYTLADLLWTIHLFRLQWLGLGSLFTGRSEVERYFVRAAQRPSFRAAVAEWPDTPPTPHVPELATFGSSVRFGWQMLSRTRWSEVVFG